MQHGGGDAGAVQPARQFIGELDVGQFGLAVDLRPGVAVLALQAPKLIFPVAWAPEDAGGHGHDPGRGAGGEPVQEQPGEQERGQVVDRERALQSVGGDLAGGPEPAHVVDQHTQPGVGRQHLSGQSAHLGLG